MNRKSIALVAFLVVALLVATAVYLWNTDIAVIHTAGPIAALEWRVILITVLLSGIVVVPVFWLLFYFAWKYRADSPAAEAHHRPDWDHDTRTAEIAWWLAPSAIIVALSVVAWVSSHTLDPYKPIAGGTPIEIQVVALEWKWLFIYPEEGIASVNMLEIPVGTPIHFSLTADAPMNSFWVPKLGGQIMVMPGMSSQLYLRADRVGEYVGSSANISGEGFSGMGFKVRAVSRDEYDTWVESVRAKVVPLDSESFGALAVPSTYNKAATYAPVEPGLYNDIIMHVKEL